MNQGSGGSGVELIGVADRQLWACKGEVTWPLSFWPGVAASTGGEG